MRRQAAELVQRAPVPEGVITADAGACQTTVQSELLTRRSPPYKPLASTLQIFKSLRRKSGSPGPASVNRRFFVFGLHDFKVDFFRPGFSI